MSDDTTDVDVEQAEIDQDFLRFQLKVLASQRGMLHAVSVALGLLGEMLIHIRKNQPAEGVQFTEQALDMLCESVRNERCGVIVTKIVLNELQ